MSSTLFTGGTIWTGDGDTDALLVTDGVVTATGGVKEGGKRQLAEAGAEEQRARARARERRGAT